MISERPTHAPCFAKSNDEPKPRVVGGYRIEDKTGRRTFDVRETRHAAPEAPDAAPPGVDSRPPVAPRTAQNGRGG